MKISGNEFLGFKIPSIPSGTIEFNSYYGELDIVFSVLREEWLTVSSGRDSDKKLSKIKIEGFGKLEDESKIIYSGGPLFVWGVWKREEVNQTKNFIGVASRCKDGSSTFYLDLNPEKISAE